MNKKILIVDFEEESIEMLTSFLEQQGFEVISAMDGNEGLETFREKDPDLVILEPLLPKLHGFELCNKIVGEDGKKVPVVIVTGVYRGIKCKHEAIHFYGASAFFEKPYQKGELLATIVKLLGERVEEKAVLDSIPVKDKQISEPVVEMSASSFQPSSQSVDASAKPREILAEPPEMQKEEEPFIPVPDEVKTDILEEDVRDKTREREEEEAKERFETKFEEILSDYGLRSSEEKKKPVTRPLTPPQGVPSQLGEYILLEKIGGGGMGEIFKAKRKGVEGFEKMVAIKRIHPHLVEENERVITMFIDEAKLSAQLAHPNIVHIYDLGKIDGYYFIAMEYVLGKDLGIIINKLRKSEKRMPYEYSVYIGMKICEALDYSHRKHDAAGKSLGIVHRDVNPKNILLSFGGEVKLTDFGVAKAASKIHQTIPGGILGKIPYLSPEQFSGSEIDYRSDIYSLGLVLFEMITGERYFSGKSDLEILNKIRKGEINPPSQVDPDMPRELEQVILKAVDMDPRKRYQSAVEFQEVLERFLSGFTKDLPNSRNIARFMVHLFSDEIKEKGIIVDTQKEDKYLSKVTPPPKREETEAPQAEPEFPPLKPLLQAEPEFPPLKPPAKAEPEYPPLKPLPQAEPEFPSLKSLAETELEIPPLKSETEGQKREEEDKEKTGFRLLLADGSVITQKIVKMAFSDMNFEILILPDGEQVVRKIETIEPDILLVELRLPKVNGYEVLEYVNRKQNLANLRVIVLREAFEKIDLERLKNLQFDEILKKPINSTDLVKFVSKILGISKSE
ncbi:MAG: protein kinase [Candidatus Aminicenantes bacterium]|nr:protein kinase [Candidatus Aminicenantes bacterium]